MRWSWLLLLAACDEPTDDDGPLDVSTTSDTGTTPVATDVCDDRVAGAHLWSAARNRSSSSATLQPAAWQ